MGRCNCWISDFFYYINWEQWQDSPADPPFLLSSFPLSLQVPFLGLFSKCLYNVDIVSTATVGWALDSE